MKLRNFKTPGRDSKRRLVIAKNFLDDPAWLFNKIRKMNSEIKGCTCVGGVGFGWMVVVIISSSIIIIFKSKKAIKQNASVL